MSSPCAMLMTPMMPNVTDRPIAASTRIEPKLKPKNAVCTSSKNPTRRSMRFSARCAATRVGSSSAASVASALSFVRTWALMLLLTASMAASRVAESRAVEIQRRDRHRDRRAYSAVGLGGGDLLERPSMARSSDSPTSRIAALRSSASSVLELSGSASIDRSVPRSWLLTVTRLTSRRPTGA